MMPRLTSLPRPVLVLLAVLLAGGMVSYSALWMYYIRWQPSIYLGLRVDPLAQGGAIQVSRIEPSSPAEQAGVKAGDRILSVNGHPGSLLYPYYEVLHRGQAGSPVRLTIERGFTDAKRLLTLDIYPLPATRSKLTWVDSLSSQLIGSYPLWFLVVGIPVLFLRLQDRNAWLMTLLFAATTAGGPLLMLEQYIDPRIEHAAAAFKILSAGSWAPLFNYFFSVFPVRSFLDRRAPWLKTFFLGGSLLVTVPLAVWMLFTPREQPLLQLAVALGSKRNVPMIVFADYLLPFSLGIVSLVGNGFFSESREVQRKIRVIVWGTLVGLMPGLLSYSLTAYLGKGTQYFPMWFWGLFSLSSFWLFPLSFAYAVVKHRVMEIPLLLRRSARYLLVQRGFVFINVLLSAALTCLLVLGLTRYFRGASPLSAPALLGVAAVFGSAIALSGIRLHRAVTEKIDRAFFRGAYNARQILEELAENIRRSTSAEQLAALLAREFIKALHPISVNVFFLTPDGTFREKNGEGMAISADSPLLRELLRSGTPVVLPVPFGEDGGSSARREFGAVPPECVVPIIGVKGNLLGFVALGRRLSDEPYSGEDQRLLASVASQAGFALETMRLASDMAERIDAERRAAQEMQIAKQVQSRLFPQTLPEIPSLDYAGGCIQARQVGGDYYDFLDLGPGRLGIVLADIAGKGISGALLMANLQANLRSQSAIAAQDLPRFLGSVNRLFLASTSEESYATLFFADYEDATHRMRYANCGHNPPLLLRADGQLERLQSTSTIIGAFSKWDCSFQELKLREGDVLLIYTDGITEATNCKGEEFGERRLASALRELRGQTANAILEAVFDEVRGYTSGEQSDDLTLVALRLKNNGQSRLSRNHL